MSPDHGVRRYPLVGGLGAWRVPVVAGALAAGALAHGAPELAAATAVLGYVAHTLWRGLVVEVGPAGLTRGFVLGGLFRERAPVMPWAAVVEVRTEWCRPGDDSALQTTVRARDGATVTLSTGMGLGAYWACP